MQKIFYVLSVLIGLVFNNSFFGMESGVIPFNHIHEYSFPKEAIATLAGHCQPCEKNLLMKVCKAFNACLKMRTFILQANPSTVTNEDKKKGMFTCARLGDADKLSVWIKAVGESRYSIDSRNILDMTALQVAIANKHADAMRVLVAHGANIKVCEPDLLHRLVYNGETEMVKVLLELEFNPNGKWNGVMLLSVAIKENNAEMVKLLLAAGADVSKNELKQVFKVGHMEVAKVLLAHLEPSGDVLATVEKVLALKETY